MSRQATALIRFPTVLMAGFASLALILTVTGLYGVLSYAVSRRQREIGIRIALGAERAKVVWMVLRDAGWLVATGLLFGCLGAAGVGRILRSSISGIRPEDPIILAAACILMAVTSFIAACLPAARAASIDPMKALRNE